MASQYKVEEIEGIKVWYDSQISPQEENTPITIDVKKQILGWDFRITGFKSEERAI